MYSNAYHCICQQFCGWGRYHANHRLAGIDGQRGLDIRPDTASIRQNLPQASHMPLSLWLYVYKWVQYHDCWVVPKYVCRHYVEWFLKPSMLHAERKYVLCTYCSMLYFLITALTCFGFTHYVLTYVFISPYNSFFRSLTSSYTHSEVTQKQNHNCPEKSLDHPPTEDDFKWATKVKKAVKATNHKNWTFLNFLTFLTFLFFLFTLFSLTDFAYDILVTIYPSQFSMASLTICCTFQALLLL